MNLAQLRGRIKNQIDFTPVPDQSLNRYLDAVINDAYMEIWSDKPYTFNSKELDIRIWKDFTPTDLPVVGVSTPLYLKFTFGSDVADFGSAFYETSDPFFKEKFIGAFVKDENNVFYEITNILSTTSIKLDRAYEGDTHNDTSYLITHRFAYLPQDLIELYDVSFPNFPINANRKGKVLAIPRRIDVSFDLNQDLTGSKANYYIPYPKQHISELPNTLSTSGVGSGSGLTSDTYYFAYSVLASDGSESGFCDLADFTVTNQDSITVTLANSVGLGDEVAKYRYKIYVANKRSSQDNYKFFHIGTINEAGTTSVSFTATILSDILTGEYNDNVWLEAAGTKKIRFHPRPTVVDASIAVGDANYTTAELTYFHIRYMFKPTDLIDDYDSPKLPTEYQHLIIDRALVDIHSKYGNEQGSMMSMRKFEKRKKLLDARYASERDAVLQRGQSMAVGRNLRNALYPNLNVTYLG